MERRQMTCGFAGRASGIMDLEIAHVVHQLLLSTDADDE